jgi:hypothetical protein
VWTSDLFAFLSCPTLTYTSVPNEPIYFMLA